jgi:hypothetical protein
MKKDEKPLIVAMFLLLMFAMVSGAVAQSDSPREGEAQSLFLRNRLDSRQLSELRRQHAPVPPIADSQLEADPLAPARTKVYKFATADYPGAAFSAVYDINKAMVVGLFNYPGSGPFTSFTVKGGIYRPVAVSGVQNTEVQGMNALGQMVGIYTDQGGTNHGFLYEAGHFTTVDSPFSSGATALYDINDSGVMAGSWTIVGEGRLHGLVGPVGAMKVVNYSGAFHTEVLGVNTAGDIVGYWIPPNATFPAYHGFRSSNGTLISLDYPGALATIAFGINDQGDIAGWYYTDGGAVTHGFIYSGGSFRTVDVPGAVSTLLTRIKNTLQITGEFVDTRGEAHGFTGH